MKTDKFENASFYWKHSDPDILKNAATTTTIFDWFGAKYSKLTEKSQKMDVLVLFHLQHTCLSLLRSLVGVMIKRYPIVISVSTNPPPKRKNLYPFSNLSGSVETGPKSEL